MYYHKCISFILTGFFLGASTQFATAQNKRESNKKSNKIIKQVPSKGPTVNVYTSSMAGDRFARKADVQFTINTDSGEPAIAIDERTVFQKIEGFGATFNEAGMISIRSLTSKDQNHVFKSLFDSVQGAGFTMMKSPIAACDFASAGQWYSYNETRDDTLMKHFTIKRDLAPDGLITFIRKAKKFGNFQIESPMDFAPDWMYYSLKAGEKHIKPQYYPALARYYSKYIQDYAAKGVTINYLNLFNEANNKWYSNVTYKEIGKMIKDFVAPQLVADGLTTKIQFGESSNRPEAIEKFPAGLDDAEVRKYVNSLTVHGYDWDKLSTLTDLHNKYPEFPIWQTEVCYAYGPDVNNVPPGGPTKLPVYGFEDGEFWGNMIVNDMKNWVSAWIYWNMVLDENGGPWLISTEHGDPDKNAQQPVVIINRNTKKVSYTGLYYYLAHFSRFVRPGAFRINCTGGSSKLNFVGFKNSDGTIVLNVINNDEASDCNIVWNNKVITQKLQPHSITTFKWKNSE
ncbi:glycoside hydrolase family 30 protein [Ferruginibacter paludis]|uniref:glycoside hydrolase family 30 protein n=1 Tax=Ferruginibacter paludis TaxID=1310417 RepID=UPI0025B4C1D0|nr:glycoside hydrolase family 30 protein [Ferruginibacter paludis]MDN3654014.1 glycoside hydrolase family 30 protein [Ferruginibacter paludis]